MAYHLNVQHISVQTCHMWPVASVLHSMGLKYSYLAINPTASEGREIQELVFFFFWSCEMYPCIHFHTVGNYCYVFSPYGSKCLSFRYHYYDLSFPDNQVRVSSNVNYLSTVMQNFHHLPSQDTVIRLANQRNHVFQSQPFTAQGKNLLKELVQLPKVYNGLVVAQVPGDDGSLWAGRYQI